MLRLWIKKLSYNNKSNLIQRGLMKKVKITHLDGWDQKSKHNKTERSSLNSQICHKDQLTENYGA